MGNTSTYVELNFTITISGNAAPYSVSVPNVVNMRNTTGTPTPALIIYKLADPSIAAGFTLGDIKIKTPCPDISLVSSSATQFIFKDEDTIAVETYKFGFYYLHGDNSYYFDPDIENEEPE